LRRSQRKLDEALFGPMNAENEEVAKEMPALVDSLLEQEEIHGMQRSRANWLRQGDKNTSSFITLRQQGGRRILLKDSLQEIC
jgi:hypothetical protein